MRCALTCLRSSSGLCYCLGHVSSSSRLDYATHILERYSLGVNIGCQSFTDVDYADDVALLAELLHILTHGLGVMGEEASLEVNWAKNEIQCIEDIDSVPQVVHVGPSQVEMVNAFTYLAACTTCDRSSCALVLPGIV